MAAEEQQVGSRSAAATCGLEYHTDESLSSRVEKILNNKLMSDVTFIVGPEKQRIYANKVHLVTASEYFYTLFYGNFAEAKRDEIELPDEDPETFLTILRLIYGAKVDINFENLRDIYERMQMYLLSTEYYKQLISFLMDQIVDKDTAMKIFRENHHYKFQLVEDACLSYIQSNPLYYFGKEDVTTLERERLLKIVRLQKINCTEEQLLEVLRKWEIANPESDTKELRKLVSGTTRACYSHKFPLLSNATLVHAAVNSFTSQFSLKLTSPKSVSLYGIGVYLVPTDDDASVALGILDSNNYTEICSSKVVASRISCMEIVDLMFEEMELVKGKPQSFRLTIENSNSYIGLNKHCGHSSVHDKIKIEISFGSPQNQSFAHLWVKDSKCGVGTHQAPLLCCQKSFSK
ncbi:BTB/POZ domain-containing protein 6-like [Anopheles moucheti]|uniref:BTB/POZ domain-containing protein 6-like n=1 Tax=Anopheles moucheti TaxID=186751 RepID=UPI0022F13704|nr:BTB/POZ domain-containing protein 6-like [Anopheles moucheti]